MDKVIKQLYFPSDVRYSTEHIWLKSERLIYRAGITDYAREQIGEIVYLDLPEVGEIFTKGEVFGSVESMQTISELFMPLNAKIVEVNSSLLDEPEILNQDPYDDGWLIGIKVDEPIIGEYLLTHQEYINLLS